VVDHDVCDDLDVVLEALLTPWPIPPLPYTSLLTTILVTSTSTLALGRTHAPVVDHDVCDDLDVVLVALVDEVTQVPLTAVAAVKVVQVTRQVALCVLTQAAGKQGQDAVKNRESDTGDKGGGVSLP
jgi:hypothetical protein